MEVFVSCISDEGILSMAYLTGQKCILYLNKGVLAWREDSIPLMDNYGKLLTNDMQVQQPTTLPHGMGAQVCRRLVSEPSRPIELAENGIYGNTGVVVAATISRW